MATVIQGGLLIDGTGGRPIPNARIVIEDGTIQEVGPSPRRTKSGSGDRIIDAADNAVLPGLFDVHVHLCVPIKTNDPRARGYSPSEQSVALAAMNGLNNAQLLVAKGITSVRDLGSHGHAIHALKQLVDTGRSIGPRITPSGRAIAVTGGHFLLGAVEADGVDAVRKAVRTEVKAGAEVIKFMASGAGASLHESPNDLHFTREELSAGILTAKAMGKMVSAHAVNSEAAMTAIEAGVTSIEHGLLLDTDALHAMAESKVALVPTLWLYQRIASHGHLAGVDPSVIKRIRQQTSGHRKVVRRAAEAGVLICAGTDQATPVHRENALFWELQWYGASGLTPMEVVLSATSNAARLLQVDADRGTLEPGKVADVLIVRGNPLDQLAALSDTDAVLKNGEVIVESGVAIPRPLIRDLDAPLPDGPLPSAG